MTNREHGVSIKGSPDQLYVREVYSSGRLVHREYVLTGSFAVEFSSLDDLARYIGENGLMADIPKIEESISPMIERDGVPGKVYWKRNLKDSEIRDLAKKISRSL